MIRSTFIATLLLAVAVPAMASSESEALTPQAQNLSMPTRDFSVTGRRPAMLPVLYGSFAALQIVDARTTFAAVARGAHETNPTLGRGNQSAIWAVKAASTASTIYFAERLWKKNRVAAVLVMAGINGGYAAIAAHNAKQAR